MRNGKTKSSSTTSAELWSKNGGILLAKSVLPICSWDWQISEPAFYEAIAPSDGCTDGFASRVREFANSIRWFLRHGAVGTWTAFRDSYNTTWLIERHGFNTLDTLRQT